MIAELRRDKFNELRTLGLLTVPAKAPSQAPFAVYSLEDRIRAPGCKVPKQTAIWEGLYRLAWNMSPKFGRMMLMICDVRDFTGIRIHDGKDERWTDGCVLVGHGIAPAGNALAWSKEALADLESVLVPAIAAGPTYLRVVNVNPPPHLLEPP